MISLAVMVVLAGDVFAALWIPARRALAADLKNIEKRVRSGKPLTQAQRHLLEAEAGGVDHDETPVESQQFARNQSELAALLGGMTYLHGDHSSLRMVACPSSKVKPAKVLRPSRRKSSATSFTASARPCPKRLGSRSGPQA